MIIKWLIIRCSEWIFWGALRSKYSLLKIRKKQLKTSDSQTWLVNANSFANKQYRCTVLFTVSFTGKSGYVYLSSWLSLFSNSSGCLKRYSKQFVRGGNATKHGQSHQNNLRCNACCLPNAVNPSRSMQNPRASPQKSEKNHKWSLPTYATFPRKGVLGETL